MAMKHPSLKYAGDKKIRELLNGYACTPRVSRGAYTFPRQYRHPRLDVSPLQVIKELWGGEWPEFVDMEAFNGLLQDLTSLWNDLATVRQRSSGSR